MNNIERLYVTEIDQITKNFESWSDYIDINGILYGVREFGDKKHMKNDCFGSKTYWETSRQCTCSTCENWYGCGNDIIYNSGYKCDKCEVKWMNENTCKSCTMIGYFQGEWCKMCDPSNDELIYEWRENIWHKKYRIITHSCGEKFTVGINETVLMDTMCLKCNPSTDNIVYKWVDDRWYYDYCVCLCGTKHNPYKIPENINCRRCRPDGNKYKWSVGKNQWMIDVRKIKCRLCDTYNYKKICSKCIT